MDLHIKGKIGVVTAASKGLGFAVAEALAAEGVHLVICSRDERRINESAAYLRDQYQVEVMPVVCDVMKKADIEDLREKVITRFGTCHILFTNAGGPPPGKVDSFQTDDYRNALEQVLLSTIELVFAFLPLMRKQRWGRILSNTSVIVKQPLPTLGLSNVARVGVVGFIKSLSQEVGPLGITANVIAPGYIMTDRVQQLFVNRAKNEGMSYDQVKESVIQTIPVRKIASPADYGSLCAYLASEQASYISGTTVLIDGGFYSGLS